MLFFLVPLIITLIIFACDIFIRKLKKPIYYYLGIFVVFFAIEYGFYATGLKANVPDAKAEMVLYENISPGFVPDPYLEMQLYSHFARLTTSQREQIQKKITYHKREGQECFKKANKICPLIPNKTDREKAIDLFEAAVAASIQGLNWSAVVTGLSVLLVKYSINAYEQWNEMNDHLDWAKYHFELKEFHEDLLLRDK